MAEGDNSSERFDIEIIVVLCTSVTMGGQFQGMFKSILVSESSSYLVIAKGKRKVFVHMICQSRATLSRSKYVIIKFYLSKLI